MKHSLLCLACLWAMTAPGLLGQSFGATVTAAKPVSDVEGGPWIHGRGATGFGLRAPYDLSSDWQVVSRLDVVNLRAGAMNLRDANTNGVDYIEQGKVQTRSLSWDLNYGLAGRLDEGTYVGFGLGIVQARFTDVVLAPDSPATPAGVTWPAAQNKLSVQYAALAGVKFLTHLGLEARFTQGNFKAVGVSGTRMQAPMFCLSLFIEY